MQSHKNIPLLQKTVEIITSTETFDITPLLKYPNDFHGPTDVHDLIDFGDLFTPTIGAFEDTDSIYTDIDALPEKGIVILTYYHANIKRVVDEINRLALRVIADPTLYDDLPFCTEYYELSKEGYRLLNKHATAYGIDEKDNDYISLERAGLVTTRLAQEKEKDAELDNEIRVVTKRTHLVDHPEQDLAVSVLWRDRNDIARIAGKDVTVADFVNPASGSSTIGFVLSIKGRNEALPSSILHKSIMGTRQGINFTRKIYQELGIKPMYYSLGASDHLNEKYYLENPAVADAGHILRHFLPKE
jgi:hypothetical protein